MQAICFAVALLLRLTLSATAIPDDFRRRSDHFTPLRPSVETIQHELGSRLSRYASLHFPSSPDFSNLTERWAANSNSNFSVVVVPAVDKDVVATVHFANRFHIPFLAVNRGHGDAAGLSAVDGGISIYIRNLDSIEVAEDGQSASMGGGVFQDQVVRYLFERGKVATSGACACTGMMGPGLGGGFGRYQGYFGLVLDNILEMDVVIADGSKITVSASSHPELFWGMRGAGHNFGIVTRFQQKIFDNPNSKWFFATLVFRADKLEALIEVLNVFGANGTQPKEATTYTLFAVNPEISPSEPVIIFTLEYGGSASSAAPILAPFYAIDPVITTNTTVPYTEAAHAAGAGLEDPPCQPLSSWKLFPVGLQTFNIRTTRALYELFSTMIAENPAFNNSIVQLEGYPQQGVRAVDPDSTAYAHRDDILLASLGAVWPPNRPELENIAVQYGHQARTLLHAGDTPGRPLNTYVNYASSDETPEMLYGHEPWRLKRLRALKRKYDPNGRFNFYNPII